MIVARSTTLFVGIDLTPKLGYCCPRRDSNLNDQISYHNAASISKPAETGSPKYLTVQQYTS